MRSGLGRKEAGVRRRLGVTSCGRNGEKSERGVRAEEWGMEKSRRMEGSVGQALIGISTEFMMHMKDFFSCGVWVGRGSRGAYCIAYCVALNRWRFSERVALDFVAFFFLGVGLHGWRILHFRRLVDGRCVSRGGGIVPFFWSLGWIEWGEVDVLRERN